MLSNILNVSGFTTLYNNTTLVSTLNVSGFTTLNNNTSIFGALNVSGFTTLNNNTSIFGALNVSGNSILNNITTLLSSFNVSGYSTLHNNTTLLSSLNVSGRTIFGNNIYNYSDSVLEAHKNFNIRKNTVNGDIVQMRVGSTLSSYLTIQEGSNITMSTPNTSSNSIIELKSQKQIKLDTPDVYITGTLSSTNIGVKSPIFFTTNRNMTINGISFSVYDIDLRKYTKSVLLDGYKIRQFRIRHWPADADFETGPTTYQYHLKRYDIFMSNRNGLSIFSLCAPIDNQLLTETFQTHFFIQKYI
jgi:hypothetical protein